MKNKEKTMGIGIGTSTIMMILVVLAFTVFATVSYLQALSQYKSAVRFHDKVNAIYSAESDAHIIGYQIEEILKSESSLTEKTRQIQLIDDKIEIEDESIYYIVTIDDQASLEIIWKIEENQLIIEKWKVHNKGDGSYGNKGFDL